ncbi:N-acetylmuramoyl-L-alanine amidase [Nocardioides sp.]|uniref:N-acetylmuramoyl-L-alanine amidase n=1 Tax=Nocardioides sp. TaxID=35761 RepID=UPI0035678D6C
MTPGTPVAVVVALLLAAGASLAPPPAYAGPQRLERTGPLAGSTVVIDPGHQLGNRNFPRRTQRLVPAGGSRKPCNTTGTATRAGYPEATLNWRVARLLKARLVELGARVRMTRHSNRDDRWGPCVDRRGRAGNRIEADLKLSVHADGSEAAGARGFHVIAPANRRPWTHDIHRPSKRLARTVRAALRGAGVPVASYTAGGDGLDVRSDLATLNLSDVPTVMVELGNMRDARDARRMTSKRGRTTYARALTRAVRRYLDRRALRTSTTFQGRGAEFWAPAESSTTSEMP